MQIINNEMPLVDAGSYHNLQNKINHESIGVQIARAVHHTTGKIIPSIATQVLKTIMMKKNQTMKIDYFKVYGYSR